MRYDNSNYWLQKHQSFAGTLRSVGHSGLSEEFNKLKYQSEADTVLSVFESIGDTLLKAGSKQAAVLDVGCGIGYWANLLYDYLGKRGLDVDLTGVDISQEALNALTASNPQAKPLQADLKTIDPERCKASFDIVYSFYCLHHLVNLDGFLNALRFAAKSVREDGTLVLMDPILTRHYSPFDVVDFRAYTGNGMPRRLFLLDDALQSEGLQRVAIRPAVSFVLNGSIEGGTGLGYATTNLLWRVIRRTLYRSDRYAHLCAGPASGVDRMLKRTGWSYSSSVCVYRKQSG